MEPVSPEEIRSVTFRTRRLRAGYDMDEVDAFLDRLEATVDGLRRSLADAEDAQAVLRSQCEQLRLRLDGLRTHETKPLAATDEARVMTAQIRNRVRQMLTEQLALLDD